MRCHPVRWLWGLIPVVMLSWLAVHLESGAIERDLEQRSGAALSAAGHYWASVAFAGRDGLLVGHAASEDQRDEAAALVDNVWGVRAVEARVALLQPENEPPARAPGPQRGFPVASAAHEITARTTLSDVAPDAVTGASAHEVALAHEEISGFSDHPPDSIVLAQDEAQPPARPPPAPTAPLLASARSVDAEKPAVVAAAPLPEPKPTSPDSVTPTLPADAKSAPPPAAATPPAEPQKAAPAASGAADVAQTPPLPQRSPRFETAALPPSNIGPEADCIAAVRAAAGPVEVHFAHGRAKLDTPGKRLIDRLIGALNTCPEAALTVAGHSDASGRARRNLALSKRRARTVTSYMAHKGIDAGRLVAIGYGDKRPVAPNDTQANRAKNRRIEVAITARAAPPPPLPVRKQGTEDGLSRR